MANLYVRKSGSDSNNGSTPALAKLTIPAAIAAASAGDIIYVGAGIYNIAARVDSSNHFTLIGDITGEHTGDAGDVIFSGMNSSFDTFISYTGGRMIDITSTSASTIKNIIVQNVKTGIIFSGIINAENVSVTNCEGISFSDAVNAGVVTTYIKKCSRTNCLGTGGFISFHPSGTSTRTINIENCIMWGNARSQSFFRGYPGVGMTMNINANNITMIGTEKTGNCFYVDSYLSSGAGVFTLKNISVSNCSSGFSFSASGGWTISGTASYINIFNCTSASNWNNITTSNLFALADFLVPKHSLLSPYSPLRGIGTTPVPSDDFFGNVRPAYGNGSVCDIGAFETRYEDVQKETTIYESGATSMKIHPCNYFKKVFQIPVTADTERTVKVKIRIDGTFISRPRVSLSGQGMTLSQATKDANTGSFEELTVSGTPTTTGIALLTIECHATNVDAFAYIDSIKLS